MKQTKLRTKTLLPNNDISFPVGTAVAVKKYSEKLCFERIFSKFKQRAIPLKGLIGALVSYKLSENLSLTRGSDWINRDEVLCEFGLKSFEQKTLYRAAPKDCEPQSVYREVKRHAKAPHKHELDFCSNLTETKTIIYGYSLWVHMTSINISIKKEAYTFLKNIKAKDESFSDIILRFKKDRSSIMRFFGILKDHNWDDSKKNIKEFRKSFSKRLR